MGQLHPSLPENCSNISHCSFLRRSVYSDTVSNFSSVFCKWFWLFLGRGQVFVSTSKNFCEILTSRKIIQELKCTHPCLGRGQVVSWQLATAATDISRGIPAPGQCTPSCHSLDIWWQWRGGIIHLSRSLPVLPARE